MSEWIEIRQDRDGRVDEVVTPLGCARVHLESLGCGNWYLRIEVESCEATINITPKRAFVYESKGAAIICTDAPP